MDIFYFWEGAPILPGYMDLCIRSWERNVPGARVTRVNHANLRGLRRCRHAQGLFAGLHPGREPGHAVITA